MSRRYEFFQKILTQLNQIQISLNNLRQVIKEEIERERGVSS